DGPCSCLPPITAVFPAWRSLHANASYEGICASSSNFRISRKLRHFAEFAVSLQKHVPWQGSENHRFRTSVAPSFPKNFRPQAEKTVSPSTIETPICR